MVRTRGGIFIRAFGSVTRNALFLAPEFVRAFCADQFQKRGAPSVEVARNRIAVRHWVAQRVRHALRPVRFDCGGAKNANVIESLQNDLARDFDFGQFRIVDRVNVFLRRRNPRKFRHSTHDSVEVFRVQRRRKRSDRRDSPHTQPNRVNRRRIHFVHAFVCVRAQKLPPVDFANLFKHFNPQFCVSRRVFRFAMKRQIDFRHRIQNHRSSWFFRNELQLLLSRFQRRRLNCSAEVHSFSCRQLLLEQRRRK